MCKYSDDPRYKCTHENLEDNDYCIFHLKDDNKDIDEFNKGIKEILKTEEDSINFNGFYFPPDTIDFKNVTFKGYTDFKDAEFGGNADFSHTKFNGTPDFRDAKFKGNVTFFRAHFSEMAIFIDCTFSRTVNFVDVTFKGSAEFWKAKFKGDAIFNDVTFEGDAEFSSAEFKGNSSFIDVTFGGKAKFMLTRFKEIFNLSPKMNSEIGFTFVYFSDNIRIKADLSKCTFANSNIERVDMTDSSWIRNDKPKNSFSAYKKRFKEKIGFSETSIKIWEEEDGDLKCNWKELEGIYRRLKQSFQKYGDNSTAGKFYYQEMECKRKQLKGIRKRFWNVFYKKLCGYGEKPFNVIGYSGLIVLASSLFFFYWGIELLGSEVLDVTPRVIDYKLSLDSSGIQWAKSNFYLFIKDWLECLYTSVITFTTLGYGDVHPIGFSRLVASVEAGFGIIMTALFIFVFTRKMLR